MEDVGSGKNGLWKMLGPVLCGLHFTGTNIRYAHLRPAMSGRARTCLGRRRDGDGTATKVVAIQLTAPGSLSFTIPVTMFGLTPKLAFVSWESYRIMVHRTKEITPAENGGLNTVG